METILEISALVTGVLYIILEIRQKSFMWVLGIFTSLTSMWLFFTKGAYASFALNAYYLITAFIGLWQWRKDKKGEDHIYIRKMSPATAAAGIAVTIILTLTLSWGMDLMHGAGILRENPMSMLDAAVAATSVTATWWLVRAYLQQWWLWIAANTLSVILCITLGMWLVALMYIAYVVAAIIGFIHWKKHGIPCS